MKEVKYVVCESMLLPEKRIFAGVMSEPDERGISTWKTRGDVTISAVGAVFRHFVAKTKRDNPNGKGMKYNFQDIEGYDIELKIKLSNKKVN